MAILAYDFREQVVEPVLERLEGVRHGMNTPAAVELLMGTAAQESQLGRFLRQHPRGPARGVYQIEPATLLDLIAWLRETPARHDLLDVLMSWTAPVAAAVDQVAGNLYLATAVARLNYYRKPFVMPKDATVLDLGVIWKRWWNTELGKGSVAQFAVSYTRFVQQP